MGRGISAHQDIINAIIRVRRGSEIPRPAQNLGVVVEIDTQISHEPWEIVEIHNFSLI